MGGAGQRAHKVLKHVQREALVEANVRRHVSVDGDLGTPATRGAQRGCELNGGSGRAVRVVRELQRNAAVHAQEDAAIDAGVRVDEHLLHVVRRLKEVWRVLDHREAGRLRQPAHSDEACAPHSKHSNVGTTLPYQRTRRHHY